MMDEFEIGLRKGVELGEANKKIEIAQKMINCKIDIELIEKITEISKKELIEIEKEMSNI